MYFDGLGRVISQYSDGPNGGNASTSITKYDANGRVGQKSYPFLSGTETEKWTQYTYDASGEAPHAG